MKAIFWRACARFLSRPAVVDWLIRRAMRTPYRHITGPDGSVYMYRYWLFNPYPPESSGSKNWFPISVRLHRIMRKDNDQHQHDHPWNARTIILRGWYAEDRPYAGEPLPPGVAIPEFHEHLRMAGDTARIEFGQYHCITKTPPGDGGVWTLFITGKYRGNWGFNVNGVKVPWRQYLGLEAKP